MTFTNTKMKFNVTTKRIALKYFNFQVLHVYDNYDKK